MGRMAKSADKSKVNKKHWVDPTWPKLAEGEHPVTELASPVAGGLSPFGDLEFPLDSVPYVHPTTVINR